MKTVMNNQFSRLPFYKKNLDKKFRFVHHDISMSPVDPYFASLCITPSDNTLPKLQIFYRTMEKYYK